MPSLSVQMHGLYTAGRNVVKAMVNGEPIFSVQHMRLKRIEVCKKCEFYDQNVGRCAKCGCFIRAKAALLSEKCPVGKW